MKANELKESFNNDNLSNAALIHYQGRKGIAIQIEENLSAAWQSGDVIVFWDNGEHTILPGDDEADWDFNQADFDVLVADILKLEKTT